MYTDVPFVVDTAEIPADIPSYRSELTSNLLNAVIDYRMFCRQVSLPHYNDDKFLNKAVKSYIEDAQLGDLRKIAYPYHKALIWKTHMSNPSAYRKDIKDLNESIVCKVHNKLQRSSGSSTVRRGKWHQSELIENVPGAMFRGDAAPLTDAISFKEIAAMGSKSYILSVIAYRLEGLEPRRNYQFFVNSKVFRNNEEATLLHNSVYGKGKIFIRTFSDESSENPLQFDAEVFDLMNLRLTESVIDDRNQYLLPVENTFSTDFSFPGNEDYDEGEVFKVSFELPTVGKNEIKSGWIKFRCDVINIGRVSFTLQMHDRDVRTATNYCDMISLPMLMVPYATNLDDSACVYVDMGMIDVHGNAPLKCRVLESALSNFTSVEVFDANDKLLACAYTVGRETLPTVAQVLHPDQCCIIRDYTEVVYVIRSTNYECGLLKVFKDSSNKINSTGAPTGILFLNLKHVTPRWQELYNDHQKVRSIYYKSDTGGLIVDIDSAKITIPPDHEEFCELLSLGTTLLSLFCVKQFQIIGYTF